MAALHDVAVAAGGSIEPERLADIVVDRARLIAGGDAAVLRWFDPATQSFQLLAASGTKPGLAEGIPLDSETAIGGAFKSGRPAIVNDYQASGRTTRWGLENKISAQVAVPLLVEARPVGTLAVLSFSGHAYDDADARFLSLLAAIVAPALEAARLKREVTRQARTVTQIYEALPVMVVVYDRNGAPMLHNTAAEAGLGRDRLVSVRARTIPLYREDGSLVPDGERPFTRALRDKQPIRDLVVGLGDADRKWLFLDAVPLLDDAGEVDAVVTSSIDITALKSAENRLRDDAERLRKLIAIQTELSQAELTEPEISGLVVHRALELSGAPGVSLQMIDGEEVVFAACAGFGHELVGTRLPAKGNPVRGCVADGGSESTEDALVDPRCGKEIAGEAGIRSLVMAPVRHEDQVIGGLQVQSPEPGAFAEGADTILELLAGFAGAAITRARAAREERDRLETVIQAQQELAVHEAELDRLLQLLAEHTLKLTDAEAALVLMPEGDGLVLRAGAGDIEVPPAGALPLNASLAGLAYRSRKVQWTADALDDPRAHAPTARQSRYRSLIHAPLVSGGNAVGVVSVATRKAGALDATDVRTVEMIAGFAAAAFERATTTRRLRASEQRTRAVMENAPDPIIVIDPAGLIVDFNPAASRAFLRPRAEMIGEHAVALLAAKHAPAFGRWLKEGRSAGSAEYAGQHFEATGRRSDGTEFPMEIAIANLAEDRQLTAAFLRDLTLREKLEESRERLAAVVSSAPVMVIACDVAGIVTVADGKGFDALGVKPEEVIGTDVRDLFDHQPEVLDSVRRAVTGEALNEQIHLKRQDIYLEGAAGPIRDAAGEIVGFTAVLTDVTDRARADAAQRDSEAKSRLMAMMNHEVRTPLNSILGFAHLLGDPRTGDLNDKQRRFVTNIHDSGNHLLKLVNDSLDIARLDAGRAGVNPADVPVSTVISQAVDQVRPLADARTLTLTAGPSDAVMHADQRHVLQILLNLLANAIRHTQPGGSVEISAVRDGGEVAVSVADTGDGIAQEDLGRIFEEFFQASNHAPGGIGLGLAISRRLAKMMGGAIEVQSQLGRGSTFTLRLPAARTQSSRR